MKSTKHHPKTSGQSASRKTSLAGFPVVGVGASAGGLEAFSQLLQGLPGDTGMAFVLVQHLDPDHPSALTQLLSLKTAMPVIEVTQGVRIEPNRIYVIPQNTSMTIVKGVLRLQPRKKQVGVHLPIDRFLESLAEDQQERAIGVILSGSATDGTQGLEMIKSEGGITFAQDESAKFDSMPRSAVAAGCVDFVLSPERIAKELANIAKHPAVAAPKEGSKKQGGLKGTVPAPRSESRGPPAGAASPGESNDVFQRILVLLRNHSGVDFSQYKTNTIQRRIARRIVLGHLDGLPAYARFLKGNEQELELLYLDVLIGVTGFFRNPEAFEILKQKVFPALLKQPDRRDNPVRVWVAGCSTGQEAYSIAMVFHEFCDTIPRAPKLQIFATDLNEVALQKARRGLYSKALMAPFSPERLARFFTEEQGGFRANKVLRESCVFARHNVLSDPPFSRMDLISCRNLMIYIELELQKKILPNFHYALKPGGFLLLGASETIGPFTGLFEAVDKKWKLYSRKTAAPMYHPAASDDGGSKHSRRPPARRAVPESLPPFSQGPSGVPRDLREELEAQRVADRLASARFAPPSVIIDADLQILQYRGVTSPYLETPQGKPSFDLLKMAREGLMLPLRAAVKKAQKENKSVRTTNIRVNQNGKTRRVNIEVLPLKELDNRSLLIFFEEAEKEAGEVPTVREPKGKLSTQRKEELARRRELEIELSDTRAYLQSIQEQYESTNEELQAANEEAQSANEELQSSNEELETSKEELESTNEELTTVNEEMASRNIELSHLNSDLINLQNSTKLAIVLLGRDLAVRRFSPQAEKQLKLAISDVGRPIGAVRHHLDFAELEKFITEVIQTVQERERQVRDQDGRWYSLRVRPYITLDNRVDGAILVLVDIDELKKKERLITEACGRAEAVIETIPDPLLILNENLRVQSANEAFYRTFQLEPDAVEKHSLFELPGWDIPRLREMMEEVIPRNSFFNDFEVTQSFEGIGRRSLLISARPLSSGAGQPRQILAGIRDISEVLAFQVQLRRSELRYRRLFEAANDGVLLIDPKTHKIIAANPFIADLLGYTREELCGKELFEVGLLKDRAASETDFRQLQANGRIRYEDLPLQTKTGQKREVEFVSNLYTEDGERIIQCNIRDITERKLAEQRFRGLLESAPDAMIISDRAGKIRLINAQAERMFGYRREELVGQAVEVLVPRRFKGPHPSHRDQFQKAPGARQMGAGRHLFGLRRDGTEFPVEISLSPVESDQGILVTAAVRDISERKESEEALRRSEERYRTLFASIDEGFCVIGMQFDENEKAIDFTFLEVNPSFEKQTGIQDAQGKRMREIVPDLEGYWFESYGKVAQTGEPVRFVQEAKRLDRWFDVYAFRLGNPEDRKVALLFNDVTANRKAEEKLRLAQTQLADRADKLERAVAERTSELTRKNKELEALVYSIAHDLRAPLRSMQGFSEMLIEESAGGLSETARDYARRVGDSAQAMDGMLRDLIAFSGIAEQQIDLEPVNFEIVVKLALASLKSALEEAKATVEAIGPWPTVLCHEATASSVLVHLIANAARFVAPNVRPVVRLHAEPRGEFVRVWVEDNGIGIAPAHQEQIFKLFTRLHGERYGGTGMGLAMVKKGIERMGGQVGVESTPGQGSRFWFELRTTNGG